MKNFVSFAWPVTPLAFICALLLNGCAGLGESLRLEDTVLVKVPIKEPIARSSGNGWEFRHVLEAPKDDERRGEWYVAWNNKNPLRIGGLMPSWRGLFLRVPEIAVATHLAFVSCPVLFEPNRTFVRVVSKQPPEPKPGQPVSSEYGSGVRLVINKMPMKVWPDDRKPDKNHPGQFVVDPMWHLDDQHSQLATARKRFEQPGE